MDTAPERHRRHGHDALKLYYDTDESREGRGGAEGKAQARSRSTPIVGTKWAIQLPGQGL